MQINEHKFQPELNHEFQHKIQFGAPCQPNFVCVRTQSINLLIEKNQIKENEKRKRKRKKITMAFIPNLLSSSFASLYYASTTSSDDTNHDDYHAPKLVSIKSDDDSDSDSSIEFVNEEPKSSLSLSFLHQEVSEQHQQHKPQEQQQSIQQQRLKKSVHFDEVVDVVMLNEEPINDIEKRLAFYNANEIHLIRKQNKSIGKFLRHMDFDTLSSLFPVEDDNNATDDDDIICLRGLEKIISNEVKLMLRMRRQRIVRTILCQQDEWLLSLISNNNFLV